MIISFIEKGKLY